MASGYFPLGTKLEEGDIVAALTLLRTVLGAWGGCARSACEQFDNSFDDGGYVSEFALGLKLIEGCFVLPAEVKAALRKAEDDAAAKEW